MKRLSAASIPIARTAFLLVSLLLGCCAAHARSAKTYFKMGQAAEVSQNYDAAFTNYQKAYSLNPNELGYKAAMFRVQVSASGAHMTNGRRLLKTGDEQGALSEFLRASEIDPGNEAAVQEIAKVRARHKEQVPNVTGMPEPAGEASELDSMASPMQLKPMSNEPLTLHMVEDSKIIYQAIGKAAGVNVLFDPDY
ncbi:MAG: tetratricopeptide repeat protein, partial [Terracidiphilus sp.]